MQDFNVFFHLGLPKVASTFLQQAIFPYLEDIEFHRKRKFNDYKNLDINALSSHHLFSSEYDRGMEDVADDIVKRFPKAKFILLVRRQDKWILSRYKYYIRKHGWVKFKDFIDLENNQGLWRTEELQFRKKIEHIERVAETKPLVVNLDLLKSDSEAFFDRITTFLGSSLTAGAKKNVILNKSFNEKQLLILRRFNGAYKYEELRSTSKLRNKLHYKYRQFLLHIIAFLSKAIPRSLIKERQLLEDPNVLDKVREYYKEDWEFCKMYSELEL